MSAHAPARSERPWTAVHRVAFRFAFVYLVLYSFPFPEGFLPGTGWLTDAWIRVDVWVGAHVLGLGEISTADTGSGDRTCNYVQLFCVAALSTLVTLVWSLADRRRKDYARLHEALRVYVRYLLALIMLLYGAIKLQGGQFFPPSVLRLTETYGQSSPQVLLWTFMGASTPYTFFAGATETIGGLLLYFRRTTTLGALVVMAVMTNVVMMNLCYDVPVKQFSLHLWIMAVFLLLPDLRRLADFFVLHQSAHLPYAPLRFSNPRVQAVVVGAKVLIIGGTICRAFSLSAEAVHAYGPLAPKHPLCGYYEIEEFTANGMVVPPLLTDESRWRTLVVARRGFVVLRTMTDAKKHFQLSEDVSEATLRFASRESGAQVLHYAWSDPGHLVVDGTFLGKTISARLRKVDEASFPLLSHKFRWIKEDSN